MTNFFIVSLIGAIALLTQSAQAGGKNSGSIIAGLPAAVGGDDYSCSFEALIFKKEGEGEGEFGYGAGLGALKSFENFNGNTFVLTETILLKPPLENSVKKAVCVVKPWTAYGNRKKSFINAVCADTTDNGITELKIEVKANGQPTNSFEYVTYETAAALEDKSGAANAEYATCTRGRSK